MIDTISNELSEYFQKVREEMQESSRKPGEFTVREFASKIGVTNKVAQRILRTKVSAGELSSRSITAGDRIICIYYSKVQK